MKKAIIPLALCLSLLLSGCGGVGSIYSNYREIEHLQPVQTLGIDSSPAGIELSVSCAKPSADASGNIISRSGLSISRAMASLQDYSAGGQLYYSHAEYVLLGEDYARGGIQETLDFMERDNALRMGMLLFVVKEGSAREIVTGPGEDSYDVTKALSSVERDTKMLGEGHAFTLRETVRQLSESGAALVCAVKSADTEGSVYLLEAGKTAVAEGYGILKGDRLVGYVESAESQAANLVLGKLGSTGPSLPDGQDGEISLKYESGSAKISPHWADDGSVESIEIKCSLSAVVSEVSSRIENVTDTQLLKALEKALEEDMTAKLKKVLQQSVDLNADFFGFMAHLRQDNAAKADALPEDWLKNVRFETSVKADIVYTQDLGDQMNNSGWGR